MSPVVFWLLMIFYSIAAVFLLVTAYVCLIGAPFVPAPQAVVSQMIKAAKLKKGMTVLDPGCGDARMLLTACREQPAIKAVGYELFFVAYLLALWRTRNHRKQITLFFRNSDYADLSQVDVMFCFMLVKPLARNAAKYRSEMKKGALILSYAFEIEGWQPHKVIPAVPERNFAQIFIYKI